MIFLLKIYNRDACRNYRVLHIFTTMYHVQKKMNHWILAYIWYFSQIRTHLVSPI